MRLYEVRVEKVTSDWGKHIGYKTIGFCINENKANEVAKDFIKSIPFKEWWMAYGTNSEGNINVEVIDRGEIIE